MITVGIDSGSRNTKAVALQDGKILGKALVLTDFEPDKAAKKVYKILLDATGMKPDDVAAVVSTGVGREGVKFVNANLTEAGSACRGIRNVNPNVNTVIDLGAEGSRAISLKPDGKVGKFAVNDRCAAGAGAFIETMARALQATPEEMGSLSMSHTNKISMNTQCVVFAESEVISLIHKQTSKEDIAYAINEGVALRLSSLVRGVGLVDEIALIGGPGNNIGLVQSLRNALDKKIFVPEGPGYISALGAAIYAAETA
jgi:predicted CoA-substrate-specific enzyme activase